jgi:hypothetical protein
MRVIKNPEFENDDYLIRLELANIPVGDSAIDELRKIDTGLANYYEIKRNAFLNQNTDPQNFLSFVDDRPSLRSLLELQTLNSTIYTVACERENRKKYLELLSDIKTHLATKPTTRRCMVRFVNGFDDYFVSETSSALDVTCLNLIHYLNSGPKLVFRASDIKNELLVDILTIFEFFIKPVYSDYKNLQMSVYCSTAQGISSWNEFIGLFDAMCGDNV